MAVASFITFWLHILGFMVGADEAVAGGAIITIVMITIAIAKLISYIHSHMPKNRNTRINRKTTGFFAQAKDRVKNKFCSKLEIIE